MIRRFLVGVLAGLCIALSTASGAQAQPPPFRILNLEQGATLADDFALEVAATGYVTYGDLWLYVDGEMLSSTTANLHDRLATGESRLYFHVDTDFYANGQHVIEIKGRGGVGGQSRTVVFRNPISNVRGDALIDETSPGEETARYQATMPKGAAWSVKIIDENNQTVRTYLGSGSNLDVTWDGRNSSGAFVPDGGYTVELSTEDPNISPARTAPPAVPNTSLQPAPDADETQRGGWPKDKSRRNLNKAQFGGCFVLLQSDVFNHPGNGFPSLAEYKRFLKRQLDLRNGVHWVKPNILEVDGRDVNSNARLRERINRQLQLPLMLFYVAAHGGHVPNPFFGIGSYCWYSNNPGSGGLGATNYNVRAWYRGQGFDPPKLAWLDHCGSAGDDGSGGVPSSLNNSWAVAFNVSGPDSVFLGAYGVVTAYGSEKQNGVLLPPSQQLYARWIQFLWTNLFEQGRNWITSYNRTNSIIQRQYTFPDNPHERYAYRGAGSMGF